MDPVRTVRTAKTAAMDLRMRTSCSQDERRGCRVTSPGKIIGPFLIPKCRKLALGKQGKTSSRIFSRRAGCRWHVCARIPKTRYDRRSFLSGHPHGLLERMRKPVVLEGCGQGSFGSPDGHDPVQDCRRLRRNPKFLQRLNLTACIDG